MRGLDPRIHQFSSSASSEADRLPGLLGAKTRFALLPGNGKQVQSTFSSA
jgi:hypothetical protein